MRGNETYTYLESDIRPWMDVYTIDGEWLGAVLRVHPGDTSDSTSGAPFAPHEPASQPDGESIGPMPTQRYGNSGPARQSPAQHYATDRIDTPSIGTDAQLFIGKYFGLTERRTIPLDAVQTVAMERIILRHRRDDLDSMLAAGY